MVRVGGRVEGGQPTASVCCFDSAMRLKDSLAVCWEQTKRLTLSEALSPSLIHLSLFCALRLLLLNSWRRHGVS